MSFFFDDSGLIVNHIESTQLRQSKKAKIKLSASKWIDETKLKKEGGFQCEGTNIGSAKPVRKVIALTHNISFLNPDFKTKNIPQTSKPS